jgi:hypothetical protein
VTEKVYAQGHLVRSTGDPKLEIFGRPAGEERDVWDECHTPLGAD